MQELTENRSDEHWLVTLPADIKKTLLGRHLNDADRRSLSQVNQNFSKYFNNEVAIKNQLLGNTEYLCKQCKFHYSDPDKNLLNAVNKKHFNLLVTLTSFFPTGHISHEKKIRFFKWVSINRNPMFEAINNQAFYTLVLQIALIYIGLEIPQDENQFKKLLSGYENNIHDLVQFIVKNNILSIINLEITIKKIVEQKKEWYDQREKIDIESATRISCFKDTIYKCLESSFPDNLPDNPIITYLAIALYGVKVSYFDNNDKRDAYQCVNIERLKDIFPRHMNLFLLNQIKHFGLSQDIYKICKTITNDQDILNNIKNNINRDHQIKIIKSKLNGSLFELPTTYFLYDPAGYRQAEKMFIAFQTNAKNKNASDKEINDNFKDICKNLHYAFSFKTAFFQLKHTNFKQYNELAPFFTYDMDNIISCELDKLNQIDLRQLLELYPVEIMINLFYHNEEDFNLTVVNGFKTLIKRSIKNPALINDTINACLAFEKLIGKNIDREEFVPFYLPIHANTYCQHLYGETFSSLLKLIGSTNANLIKLATHSEQHSTVNFIKLIQTLLSLEQMDYLIHRITNKFSHISTLIIKALERNQAIFHPDRDKGYVTISEFLNLAASSKPTLHFLSKTQLPKTYLRNNLLLMLSPTFLEKLGAMIQCPDFFCEGISFQHIQTLAEEKYEEVLNIMLQCQVSPFVISKLSDLAILYQLVNPTSAGINLITLFKRFPEKCCSQLLVDSNGSLNNFIWLIKNNDGLMKITNVDTVHAEIDLKLFKEILAGYSIGDINYIFQLTIGNKPQKKNVMHEICIRLDKESVQMMKDLIFICKNYSHYPQFFNTLSECAIDDRCFFFELKDLYKKLSNIVQKIDLDSVFTPNHSKHYTRISPTHDVHTDKKRKRSDNIEHPVTNKRKKTQHNFIDSMHKLLLQYKDTTSLKQKASILKAINKQTVDELSGLIPHEESASEVVREFKT